MVDVFVNGVKFVNGVDYTATNGTTVVLTNALTASQIVEIDNYLTAFLPTNALRTITTFTATAGQTTFSVTYTQGLIDVYYNGSCLAQSEYTATNGTSIVLATACQVNDIVVVYAYSYSVGAYSGIGGSGTTNYVAKFTASSSIGNSLIQDDGTSVTLGTASATVSSASNTYLNVNKTGGVSMNIISTSAQGIVGTVNDYPLVFRVNDSAKMYVLSSGNVGIGTSSPTVPLEIQSTSAGNVVTQLNLLNLSSADGSGSRLNFTSVGDNSTSTGALANVRDSSGVYSMRFYTYGGGANSERMRITADGNVGIGTAGDTSYRLFVKGVDSGTSNWSLLIQNGGGSVLFRIRNDGLMLTGTQTNSPYNLPITTGRTAYLYSDGSLGYQSSVRKSKTNIESINDTSWLLSLNPVSFNKRFRDDEGNYTDEYWKDLDYGLIAEEAELVNSNICFYDETEEGRVIRGVSYEKLITPMLKLIQELKAEVEELRQIVATK